MRALEQAEDGQVVTIQDPTRSLDQNAALWPLLSHLSKVKPWPVNGAMVNMTPDDWKNLLSAAFRRETGRIAQGLDGGMVLLGVSTRAMGKREFSDFLEFIHASAAQLGVELPRIEPEGK